MNKLRLVITVISIALLLLIARGEGYAYEQASGSSAALNSVILQKPEDNRTMVLEKFLQTYDSPLAPFARDFVESADRYNLDWRLVASIAGIESTFGKHIPYNSKNAWGWGVYGDNVIRFNSWSEGIETISKGLRVRYLKERQESDPYFIGPTYAASPTWALRVSFFMNKIAEYELKNGKSTLALAL